MLRFLILSSLMLIGNIGFGQCNLPQVDFNNCAFWSIGHRGYPSVFPENTLLGLEELFKRGVKYAECDVILTKDDKYILFHDEKAVYRTTNATGDIDDYTLAEVQQWDAGSWKGSQFAGSKIPTLEEALLLAQKYDAHLYLDCKSYDVNAMKAALLTTGVDPDRLMPSIATLADAQSFRTKLPNTPWIWYSKGELPANVNDADFYQQNKNLGCIGYEVTSGSILDSNWITFINNVHATGLKVVVFTVNETSEIKTMVEAGADGMESDRAWEASKTICNNDVGSTYDSATIGNWNFNGNLFGTGVGSQIRPVIYQNTAANQTPQFASCTDFGLPLINNQNKVVMKLPAQSPENGLLVYNNSRIEDEGILDKNFTVIIDMLLPTSSAGKWFSIFQTSVLNLNDADLFINPSGALGISEQYHGKIEPGKWYRVAFSINGNTQQLKKYINGVWVGTTNISGTRWAIWNSSRSGDDQGFLIFADDDNETGEVFVSNLQLRNYVMNDTEIAKLGSAAIENISIGNADVWNAKLTEAFADSTILDYENRTYYFVLPNDFTSDSVELNYTLSYGATANIALTKRIALSQFPYSWQVKSEDNNKNLTWHICARKTTTEVGFKEEVPSLDVMIYPNPTKKYLNIITQNKGSHHYKLINLNGILLKTGEFNQQLQLDVSNINKGQYWIHLECGGKTTTKSFIVE